MKLQKDKYKIGELAQLLDIKQFVVRFWEKEFNIKPNRSDGGHRFYTVDHYEKFRLIKELLYQKKFTLEGAKNELKNFNNSSQDIIPSQRTSIDKTKNNSRINLKILADELSLLKNQLLKLKELL